MTCTRPVSLKDKLGEPYMSVPCGKCVACRINHSREWSLRAIHELDNWDKALFITLTYRDECLVKIDGSDYHTLEKDELVKFIKRLRFNIAPQKIKYYACGEYGSPTKTRRPHYHLIIYGLGWEDVTVDKDNFITSGVIFDSWDKGHIHCGSVNSTTISYVSQYIEKKFLGSQGKKVYLELMRIEPPFQLSSSGFGLKWAKQNQAQLQDNLYTTRKGKKVKIPRYYVRSLKLDLTESLKSSSARELDKLKKYAKKGINSLQKLSKYREAVSVQSETNVRTRADLNARNKI